MSQHACNNPKGGFDATFPIERNFAAELEVTKDNVDSIQRINDEAGREMADLVFKCRQEKDLLPLRGTGAGAMRQAAKAPANIPADVISSESPRVDPDNVD